MESHNKYSREYAAFLDKEDQLSNYRDEFYIKKERIYLDGNSLGLLSKRAEQSVFDIMASWKELAIDGWTEGEHPWFYLSESLGNEMASLVGAGENEGIVTGSTTSNLHQLITTFYEPKGNRTKILADDITFPSDIYALKSHSN